MNRNIRQKIGKQKKQKTKQHINQLEETNSYRLHPATPEYTLFSSGHQTFSRIDYMLGHKAKLEQF